MQTSAIAHDGSRGWLARHRWLLLRRSVQFGILALFLIGPLAGVWLVEGTLAASLTLGVLPLTDPLILLQSLAAGHSLAWTAILGALIVLAVYAVIGGRTYCSFVCPINPVTDFANWLHRRWRLPKGWQPQRATRLWLMLSVLAASAATGTVAWEYLNPITMLHRGLLFGIGFGWTIVLAVFLFDLLVSRRGWCGHLCPVGAFYGLLGSASLIRVKAKRRQACNDCMDCYAVCPEPHVIAPALKGESALVLSRDCTNCGRCIDVCDPKVFAFDFRFSNQAAGQFNAGGLGTPGKEIKQ